MKKKDLVKIEFSSVVSSIKLSSGEEIIGILVSPLEKYKLVANAIGKDFHSYQYVFFPSKVTEIINVEDKKNLMLGKWSYLNGSNVHPIPKSSIISIVNASEPAELLFEQWFISVYNLKPKEVIYQTVRTYFGIEELPKSKGFDDLPQIYSPSIFKDLSTDSKDLIYKTILANFTPISSN